MVNIEKNKKVEQLEKIVYKFARLAKIEDQKSCDDLIKKLNMLGYNDIIDSLIISLNSLLNRGVLTEEEIYSNTKEILELNPNKYTSNEDLIKRLKWLKSMNLEYPKMPLEKNHELVLEAFEEFNKLIKNDFDCYYTGGLIGYLAIGHKLERYHGDLDLFINEDQLKLLYERAKQSKNFKFVSNMNNKEEPNGHEYKIIYKNTPMSIGLFLFSRLPNKELVMKEYYYQGKGENKKLFVDEQHLAKNYAALIFSEEIRNCHNTYYKMQSLENIYVCKKDSRPKDRYDATIIKDYVDLSIVDILDKQKQCNYNINHKLADKSKVSEMEDIMKNKITDLEYEI